MTETVAYEQGQEFLMEIFHDEIVTNFPISLGAITGEICPFSHQSESNDFPG
jgi:hypothetical protein